VLPFLLLFLMLLKKNSDWRKGQFWVPLLPFIVLSGAGAVLHIAIARQTTVISAAYYGSFSERLAVALQIPFFYLKKTLLPTDLSAFYAENFSQSLTSPIVLLAAVALILLTIVAWLLRKKCPEILLGGGWFIITLLPVSNLFATSPVAADRYMFLPSFGLAFTAAALLGRLRLPLKGLVVIALLVLSFFAALTFRQNRVWHDDISLWRATASRSPQVAGVWFNLGRALHRTPQLSMALEAYLRAVKLDPANLKSLDNAAALFPSSRGPISERHDFVRSLAEQMPDYPGGLPQIGNVKQEWRHPDAAEELFFYLLAADPRSVHLRLAMANFYRKMGADDRAAAILRQ
jgi:tetratricopeptide (TPR) repeat protein